MNKHEDDVDDNFVDPTDRHDSHDIVYENVPDAARLEEEDNEENERRHAEGEKRKVGVGSRANYSLDNVDEFVRVFNFKYSESRFGIKDVNASYLEMLQATNKLKWKGARLRAFINNKG